MSKIITILIFSEIVYPSISMSFISICKLSYSTAPEDSLVIILFSVKYVIHVQADFEIATNIFYKYDIRSNS